MISGWRWEGGGFFLPVIIKLFPGERASSMAFLFFMARIMEGFGVEEEVN